MSLSLPTHCHFDIIEYVKICIGLQLDGITSHAEFVTESKFGLLQGHAKKIKIKKIKL